MGWAMTEAAWITWASAPLFGPPHPRDLILAVPCRCNTCVILCATAASLPQVLSFSKGGTFFIGLCYPAILWSIWKYLLNEWMSDWVKSEKNTRKSPDMTAGSVWVLSAGVRSQAGRSGHRRTQPCMWAVKLGNWASDLGQTTCQLYDLGQIIQLFLHLSPYT